MTQNTPGWLQNILKQGKKTEESLDKSTSTRSTGTAATEATAGSDLSDLDVSIRLGKDAATRAQQSTQKEELGKHTKDFIVSQETQNDALKFFGGI